MISNNRTNYLFISGGCVIITLSYLLTEYIITGQHFGVPLDDVWIHFRYAENFSQGHLFEYNVGEPTPGTSSPLWVILISISFLLRLDPIVFSIALSSLFFLLTCFETYRLSLRLELSRNFSLMAAMLVVFAGRLAWSSLSGMEITLFCWLTLFAANLHLEEVKQNQVNLLTGLVFGLASVTRPEGVLLAMIYFGITLLQAKGGPAQVPPNTQPKVRRLILSIIIFLFIILPYGVFSYLHTGSFLPNTFKGQGGEFRLIPDITFLRGTGKLFFKDNVIILILWFTAMGIFIRSLIRGALERNFLLINLWIILLPMASSVLTPNWRHHGRYLIPLIPFVIIASLHVVQRFKDKIPQAVFKSGMVVMVLLTLVSTVVYGRALGWNVENINHQQVKVAEWLNQSLPEEKVFGMNDIGAIGFITKKKVVDMAGLVNPAVFQFQKMPEPEGTKNLLKLLKDSGVNYIIIYPHWYQYLTSHYADALEKIYSARLAYNTICGGDEAVVYKIKWDLISFHADSISTSIIPNPRNLR